MSPSAQTDHLDQLLTHKDWVAKLARSLVSDQASAEDITQEAWLAALKNPPRPEKARAWFYQVLRTQVARLNRSDRNRRDHESRLEPPRKEEPTSAAWERALMLQQVVEMTLKLEDPFREVILLRYLEELPPHEIATRLRIPLNTVTSRLQRGLKRLREKLRRQHGEGGWMRALTVLILPPAELRQLRLAESLSWSGGASWIGGACVLALGVGAWTLLSGLGPQGGLLPPAPVVEAGLAQRSERSSRRTPVERWSRADGVRTTSQPHELRSAPARAPIEQQLASPGDTNAPVSPQDSVPATDLLVTCTGSGFEQVVRLARDGSRTVVAHGGVGRYWVGNAVLPNGDWACAAVSGEDVLTPALNLFDATSGELLRSFELPEIRFPGDVAALSDGTLAVSDRCAPRVELYTPAGRHLSSLSRPGLSTWGLFIDQEDVLWSGDPVEGRVYRFDRSGRELSNTRVGYPMGDLVPVGDGTFWTLRAPTGVVEHFDLDGNLLHSFSAGCCGNGLALEADRSLWFSSVHSSTLLHLSPRGEILDEVSLPEGLHPEFLNLTAVARPGRAYCFGDEVGVACPCGNRGASGRGCANSSGVGARLSAGGSASVARADLELWGEGLPAGEWAVLVAGSSAAEAGSETAFGDGLRCTGGRFVRLGMAHSDEAGMLHWGAAEVGRAAAPVGEALYFQMLYRDSGSAGGCGSGFNTSHGLVVDFRP